MQGLLEALQQLGEQLCQRRGWLITMAVLWWCTEHESAHHRERAGAAFDEHQKTSSEIGKVERIGGERPGLQKDLVICLEVGLSPSRWWVESALLEQP